MTHAITVDLGSALEAAAAHGSAVAALHAQGVYLDADARRALADFIYRQGPQGDQLPPELVALGLLAGLAVHSA